MIENIGKILLVDHQNNWAERFVNALQVRGWQVTWTTDVDHIFQSELYSVYLINLSHPNVEPKEICDYIRRVPKGENTSIFLLNDGEAALKSFEEALSIGADGLYFHKSQMPLLLTNFPPKHNINGDIKARSERSTDSHHTFSSRHFGAGITLGGSEREGTLGGSHSARDRHEKLRTVHNQDRVTHMSLNHIHHQKRSHGYVTNSLSVSDIEDALANVDEQSLMGKSPVIETLSSHVDSPLPKRAERSVKTDSNTPMPMKQIANNRLPSNYSSLKTPLATPYMSIHKSENLRDHQALSAKTNPSPTVSLTSVPSLPWGQSFKLQEVAFCQALGHIISHRLTLNLSIYEDRPEIESSQAVELNICEGEIIGVSARDLVLTLMKHLIAQSLINQRDAERIIKNSSYYIDSQSQIDGFLEAIIEVAPNVIDQLDEVMELVLLKQVYRLFELSRGQAKIQMYQRPTDIHRFKVRPARLLINGIRESMSKLRLYKLFGTPKVMPTFDNITLYLGQLNEVERSVIQGAQGHRSVHELAQDSGLTTIDTLALCYAFSLLGEASLNDLSPLKLFYQRACTQDYYQLLSLDYSASDEQIWEAWQQHRQWLSEQRGQPQLITPLIEIVNDAYCVLAHPPLRVRYLNSLEKPIYSDMSIMPQSYAPSPKTREPEVK